MVFKPVWEEITFAHALKLQGQILTKIERSLTNCFRTKWLRCSSATLSLSLSVGVLFHFPELRREVMSLRNCSYIIDTSLIFRES